MKLDAKVIMNEAIRPVYERDGVGKVVVFGDSHYAQLNWIVDGEIKNAVGIAVKCE